MNANTRELNYEHIKKDLFGPNAIPYLKVLLNIKDLIDRFIKESGACTEQKVLSSAIAGTTDPEQRRTCIDILIELRYVRGVWIKTALGTELVLLKPIPL